MESASLSFDQMILLFTLVADWQLEQVFPAPVLPEHHNETSHTPNNDGTLKISLRNISTSMIQVDPIYPLNNRPILANTTVDKATYVITRHDLHLRDRDISILPGRVVTQDRAADLPGYAQRRLPKTSRLPSYI